jgi:mycothiol synthase
MMLQLATCDFTDQTVRESFHTIVRRATVCDGQAPFSDQVIVDAASGVRTVIKAFRMGDGPDNSQETLGYAIVGHGELEFVIAPLWRGYGWGEAMLKQILTNTHESLRAWSHGNHPAAQALAARHGFTAMRTVRQLILARESFTGISTVTVPDGITLNTFQPGADDMTWVELNTRVFSHHPEQGKLTLDDLTSRQSQNWFNPNDFLIARADDGSMVGYNWMKIEPGSRNGEIYALGVDPTHGGRGLGRTLMNAGITHLHEGDIQHITLFVEGDNFLALKLYRSLGFIDRTINVQYYRPVPPMS